jgi:ribose transport system permease protein
MNRTVDESQGSGQPVAAPEETRRGAWRNPSKTTLAIHLERFALPAAWVIVVIIFGILRPSTYLTGANFANIFGSQAVLVVLALALLIPLMVGDYDLSVAAILTFSGMVLAVLNVQDGVSIGWCILIALGIGLIAGLINGAFVVVFGINPLIVTLGTGTVMSGLTFWVSGSSTITGVDQRLVDWVVVKEPLGVAIEFYYAIALACLLWYVFDFTPLGQRMLFVGSGRSVSRLSGINVGRVRWGALAVSGVISGGAGVLYAGTIGAADPTSGANFLLPAFAAAYLGSTSIRPGRFNPWGCVVAVYFLISGITGLQLLGAESYVQQLFYGGALVIAVTLSQLTNRRRRSEA